MSEKILIAKEKKCPKCGSEQVGITGGSTKALGRSTISLECFECGEKFLIPESHYKP